MKTTIRTFLFETNSSSTHALVILSEDERLTWQLPDSYLDLADFNWDDHSLSYNYAWVFEPNIDNSYGEEIDYEAVLSHPRIGVIGDNEWEQFKEYLLKYDAGLADQIEGTDLVENKYWRSYADELRDPEHLDENFESMYVRGIQHGFIPFLTGDYYVGCNRSRNYFDGTFVAETDEIGDEVWLISRGDDGHNPYGGE